ncbi:MAG: GNAT family N-acetyltransferase [Anaerolineae bacterium]|nr:GNAT family N-acetyltransferase [Anaerolineae bacterium]
MIQLKPLTVKELVMVPDVIVGHESNQIYAVEWNDSEQQCTFRLRLKPLPETRQYPMPPSGEDLARYDHIIQQGTSVGAWENELLVGVAIAEVYQWNRSLMLWEFHVRREFHRRGIGWLMMEEMVSIARAQRMRVIVCETQNTNVPAIRFYRAMGFTLDGVDVSLYSNQDLEKGSIALYMKRKLE